MDNHAIPTYNKVANKPVFLGRRMTRGRYKSSDGIWVHADINGAGDIGKKAGYEGASLLTGGVANTPRLIGL